MSETSDASKVFLDHAQQCVEAVEAIKEILGLPEDRSALAVTASVALLKIKLEESEKALKGDKSCESRGF